MKCIFYETNDMKFFFWSDDMKFLKLKKSGVGRGRDDKKVLKNTKKPFVYWFF